MTDDKTPNVVDISTGQPTSLAPVTTTADVEGLGTIVIIDESTLRRCHEIRRRIAALGLVTLDNLAAADKAVKEAKRHDKDVEKRRKAINQKWADAKRLVDDAAADAKVEGPALERIERGILDVLADERRKRQEAERERDRIAAEAAAAIAKAREKATAREREIRGLEVTSSPEEAATIDALRAESAATQQAESCVARDLAGIAWQQTTELESSPLPKTATGSRTVYRLVITDPSQIPYEIDGVVLVEPKRGEITKLLRDGVAVPGCEWVPTEESVVR